MQDDDLCRLAEEVADESATLPILLVSIGLSPSLHLSSDQLAWNGDVEPRCGGITQPMA